MTQSEQSYSPPWRTRWYIRRHRIMRRMLSLGPVRFMGAHSGKLWWDVRTPHGWLVVDAGRFRNGRPQLPVVFWSPNATAWHHRARNILRARREVQSECVCGAPDCTMPAQKAGCCS